MPIYLFQVDGEKPDMAKEWKYVAGADYDSAALAVVRNHLLKNPMELLTPKTFRVHLIQTKPGNPSMEGELREVHTMVIGVGTG